MDTFQKKDILGVTFTESGMRKLALENLTKENEAYSVKVSALEKERDSLLEQMESLKEEHSHLQRERL